MTRLLIALSVCATLFMPARAGSTGPLIQIDSLEYDVGTVEEGVYPTIVHSFKFKNTGSETLVFDRVKPGCGCTGVVFDTTVLPGKSGSITPTLNMHAISGEFHKTVSVLCNAKNNPSFTLTLSGRVLPFVDINKYFLRFKPNADGASSIDILMRSRKADFKINEVKFIEQTPTGSDWQQSTPVFPKFTATRSEKPDPEGYYEFTVIVNMQMDADTRHSGEFTFATNHPKKDIITIRGMVDTFR